MNKTKEAHLLTISFIMFSLSILLFSCIGEVTKIKCFIDVKNKEIFINNLDYGIDKIIIYKNNGNIEKFQIDSSASKVILEDEFLDIKEIKTIRIWAKNKIKTNSIKLSYYLDENSISFIDSIIVLSPDIH